MVTHNNTFEEVWVSKLKRADYTAIVKAGAPSKQFEFPVFLDSDGVEWVLPQQYTWYKIADFPNQNPRTPREGALVAAFVRYNKPVAKHEPTDVEIIRNPAELAAKHERDVSEYLAGRASSRMEQQTRASGTSNSQQAAMNAIAQAEREQRGIYIYESAMPPAGQERDMTQDEIARLKRKSLADLSANEMQSLERHAPEHIRRLCESATPQSSNTPKQ